MDVVKGWFSSEKREDAIADAVLLSYDGKLFRNAAELREAIGDPPLAGIELVDKGLIDTLAKPIPKIVSFSQLKHMINETSRIEGQAKFAADGRLAGTVNRELNDSAAKVAPLLFLVIGAYMALYRAPKAFTVSLPAQSVFLRRYHGTNITPQRLELMVQKRRIIYSATTPRMLMFMAASTVVTGIGLWFSHINRKHAADHEADLKSGAAQSGENFNYHDVTEQSVLYYNHTELVLKWLYAVYYHHPVYRTKARSEKHRPYYARPEAPDLILEERDSLTIKGTNPQVQKTSPPVL